MKRIPFFIQPRNNIQKQASLKQKLKGTDTVFPLECSAFLFSVKGIVSIKKSHNNLYLHIVILHSGFIAWFPVNSII